MPNDRMSKSTACPWTSWAPADHPVFARLLEHFKNGSDLSDDLVHDLRTLSEQRAVLKVLLAFMGDWPGVLYLLRNFCRAAAGVTQFTDDASVCVNRLGSTGGHETVLEAFYLISLPYGITLQPDLQWIGTPGGGDGATVEDALIGTIRIQIAF